MFSLIQSLLPVLLYVVMAGSGAPSHSQASLARDSQRRADVNTILAAVWQYAGDHKGALPSNIPAYDAQEICSAKNAVKPCVDLKVLAGDYVVALPSDPQAPDGHTWYAIVKSGENRVTVRALHPETETFISVTR